MKPNRLLIAFAALVLVLGLPLGVSALVNGTGDGLPWSQRDRSSSGLAPDPARTPEAVVQVYAARTYGWRGIFAVHSWIILKEAGADHYDRVEVVSWGAGSKIRWNAELPDARWLGAEPAVLGDIRGEAAQALIPAIREAVASYPWGRTYRAYPGPNSNTFVASIIRAVPGLEADLPANAMGKDWRPLDNAFGLAPSGGGFQVNLYGLLGVLMAPKEGVEVNVLGLSAGLDADPPSLRLPGLGAIP
jgi:hypothetical protein